MTSTTTAPERCSTCHRQAHVRGWQGHYFTGICQFCQTEQEVTTDDLGNLVCTLLEACKARALEEHKSAAAHRLGVVHAEQGKVLDTNTAKSAALMTSLGEFGETTEANADMRGRLCDAYNRGVELVMDPGEEGTWPNLPIDAEPGVCHWCRKHVYLFEGLLYASDPEPGTASGICLKALSGYPAHEITPAH